MLRLIYCLFFIFVILSGTVWVSGSSVRQKVENNCQEDANSSDTNLGISEDNERKMPKFQYPEARRDESILDNYHGVEIKDPYRWLEDPDSEETKAFVDAQNALTMPFLESCPSRKDINDRLTELWNFPKFSCPSKHGDKYYFFKNSGLQNQSVLYVQDTLDSEPRVFFDPNTLSDDGTVAISISDFSDDGKTYAYGLSASGSDWTSIHFMNTETGEKYPEVLEKVKYSYVMWTKDNKGIFYGTYPEQTGVTDGSETAGSKNQKLCYHYVGTPQSQDVVVVEFPEEPLWRMEVQVTECGKWVVVSAMKEVRNNLIFITKLTPGAKIDKKFSLTKVVDKLEADYGYVTSDGSYAIFRTNKNAPNFRLIKINLEDPVEDKWTVLLPEHPENVLEWAVAVDGDKFVANYLQDVKSVLQLYSLKTGEFIRSFPLDVGAIVGFSGDKKYSEIFYKFTSFLTPGIIYKMDLAKDQEPTVYREITVNNFNPKAYKTTQVFYPSKDGTKIPMFIVTRADVMLNGTMPALLYGYGGFNVSIQPCFSVTRLVFVQHFNGVLAIANIRGGGEYGERWHNAGRFMNKQNVFDDFEAAAEYLIANNYTSASNLTIQGGSNGGLLVAACINQRPDLFGAAIAQVGVMDMLRYHHFTIGYSWISDYGSSDDPEHFEYLVKYSPLHNVKVPQNGVQYPATLLLTADHDDRVVPLHSLKLIATLQHTIGKLPQQKNPLFARIETKVGHGGGKPTTKVIEENTDILSFITQTLGLTFKK